MTTIFKKNIGNQLQIYCLTNKENLSPQTDDNNCPLLCSSKTIRARLGCYKAIALHSKAVDRKAKFVFSCEGGKSGGNRLQFNCNDDRCSSDCVFWVVFDKSRKKSDNINALDSNGNRIDNSAWKLSCDKNCFEHMSLFDYEIFNLVGNTAKTAAVFDRSKRS